MPKKNDDLWTTADEASKPKPREVLKNPSRADRKACPPCYGRRMNKAELAREQEIAKRDGKK